MGGRGRKAGSNIASSRPPPPSPHHILPLLMASLMNTLHSPSFDLQSDYLVERRLTLKWRRAELSFQCIREGLGEDGCGIVLPGCVNVFSSVSMCIGWGLAEELEFKREYRLFLSTCEKNKTPDIVNDEMGFTVLFYPTSLLSFHKKENYWFPGKGSQTQQCRTGCPGQWQRALSFPTPARHTHPTAPPRSLWMCVCITARPFKGMQSCQRSKPEETSRTPFVTFHELPECQKAMCGQGWSGDLPNALIRRQDYTVSIKVSHQPWLYWRLGQTVLCWGVEAVLCSVEGLAASLCLATRCQ